MESTEMQIWDNFVHEHLSKMLISDKDAHKILAPA